MYKHVVVAFILSKSRIHKLWVLWLLYSLEIFAELTANFGQWDEKYEIL